MDDEERLKGLSEVVVYLLADVSVNIRSPRNYNRVPELVDLLKGQKYIKINSHNIIELTKKGKNLYGCLLEKIGEEVDFSQFFNR